MADRAYHRAWYWAHRDEELARQKRWRDTHQEHRAAYDAEYRATHREEIAAKERERDGANREAVRTKNNQWYHTNAEVVTARIRAKRAADPEQARAKVRARYATPSGRAADQNTKAKRRAQKANAPVNDLTHAQWVEIQEAQGHRCYYCHKRRKGKLTQDHLTPLSKGGSHTLHNVIAVCSSCNSKKGTKKPPVPVQPFLLTLAPSRKPKAS